LRHRAICPGGRVICLIESFNLLKSFNKINENSIGIFGIRIAITIKEINPRTNEVHFLREIEPRFLLFSIGYLMEQPGKELTNLKT